jgi:hypothetical protein
MNHKLIAWDLEIYKVFSQEQFKEVAGNLWRLAPLGISVGAAVCSDGRKISWHSGMGEPMTRSTARTMLQWLVNQHAAGWRIVTWNGAAFDCRLAYEVSEWFRVCRQLALVHYDPMLQFAARYGFRIGLQAVADGLKLGDKTMHGSQAPVLWRGDEADCQTVIEYCIGDCQLTLDIAEHIQDEGYVIWRKRNRGVTKRDLGKLKPVAQVVNGSGSTEPILYSATAWMDRD